MKRLFKRKKNQKGSQTGPQPVISTSSRPSDKEKNKDPNETDSEELEAGYSIVRSPEVPITRTRRRASGRSSANAASKTQTRESHRPRAGTCTVDERPRMHSPVEMMDERALAVRNAVLTPDQIATEPPYARVNKRKAKKNTKQPLMPDSAQRLGTVNWTAPGGSNLAHDATVLNQLQQTPELGSLRATSEGLVQLSVSPVESSVGRYRRQYSPAHVGKLEIVRQGNSFVVESESDPVNDRSSQSPHYDVLDKEVYSESETSPETIRNTRQGLQTIQGIVQSEREISVNPHDTADLDGYDHVHRQQAIDYPTHVGELSDCDHVHRAHSEPLLPLSPRTATVHSPMAAIHSRTHTCSHSPHSIHRHRETSPGERTTASAPETHSLVPGDASRQTAGLEHIGLGNGSPLQLLHLSATSLVSASSGIGEGETNRSMVGKNLQSQKDHEVSAQVTALQQVVAELQIENESLRQLSSSVQEGSNVSTFLRRENAVLLDENKQLKETVHRLAVELSRYQARHPGGPPFKPKIKITSKQGIGSSHALFVAYDERLKEKDDILRIYESHLESLKQQVNGLSEENRRLGRRLKELNVSQPLSSDEWLKIQEQVKVVLDENALLVEEREAQHRKVKAQLAAKDREVAELSDQISTLSEDKTLLRDEIQAFNLNFKQLKERCERMTVEGLEKMPIEEHLASIEECHRVTQDVERRCKAEAENAYARLHAVLREKQSLEAQRAEAAEHVARLQADVAARKRSEGRYQRQIASLRSKLLVYKQREITSVALLRKAVEAAEAAQAERNAVGELAQERERTIGTATNLLREDGTAIGRLQEKLERYKVLAKKKLDQAAMGMQERDREYQSQQRQYLEEIRHLQQILRDKQRQLESIASEKRDIELELELVVKSVRSDNNAVRASVRRHADSAGERERILTDTEEAA